MTTKLNLDVLSSVADLRQLGAEVTDVTDQGRAPDRIARVQVVLPTNVDRDKVLGRLGAWATLGDDGQRGDRHIVVLTGQGGGPAIRDDILNARLICVAYALSAALNYPEV